MTKRILIVSAAVLVVCIAVCIIFTVDRKGDEIRLQGEYSAVEIGTGVSLSFDGDRMTVRYMSAGLEVYCVSGTYSIKGESITVSLEGDRADEAQIFDGAHELKIGDGYIIFDSIVYKSVD